MKKIITTTIQSTTLALLVFVSGIKVTLAHVDTSYPSIKILNEFTYANCNQSPMLCDPPSFK